MLSPLLVYRVVVVVVELTISRDRNCTLGFINRCGRECAYIYILYIHIDGFATLPWYLSVESSPRTRNSSTCSKALYILSAPSGAASWPFLGAAAVLLACILVRQRQHPSGIESSVDSLRAESNQEGEERKKEKKKRMGLAAFSQSPSTVRLVSLTHIHTYLRYLNHNLRHKLQRSFVD